MANIGYETFLEYVLPHVPGVPESTAKRCIRDAVIDFCDETRTYNMTLDSVVVPDGAVEIEMDIPSITRIAGVNSVLAYGGYTLSPLEQYTVSEGVITLTQPASGIQSVIISVSLKPSRAAATCPGYLFEDWAEVIGNGAQALLFDMANEEWFDPKQANTCRMLYLRGVNKAKRYGRTGRITGNSRIMDIVFD